MVSSQLNSRLGFINPGLTLYGIYNLHNLYMGMSQNLGTLVKPKIAGKWMFIPQKMVLIGIDS